MTEVLIIGGLALFLGWFLWGLHCNQKTYDQRIYLLHKMHQRWSGTEKLWDGHNEFERVSYDNHFKALLWFRNPWKLYRNEIQELMK